MGHIDLTTSLDLTTTSPDLTTTSSDLTSSLDLTTSPDLTFDLSHNIHSIKETTIHVSIDPSKIQRSKLFDSIFESPVNENSKKFFTPIKSPVKEKFSVSPWMTRSEMYKKINKSNPGSHVILFLLNYERRSITWWTFKFPWRRRSW